LRSDLLKAGRGSPRFVFFYCPCPAPDAMLSVDLAAHIRPVPDLWLPSIFLGRFDAPSSSSELERAGILSAVHRSFPSEIPHPSFLRVSLSASIRDIIIGGSRYHLVTHHVTSLN